jgi:prepilin-type N-terminal cleavage/methylation domain-containing protein
MNHDNRQSGFTLIELLLAMTFISVLLLAIALTIIQISTIYNRGIILKEVNQVGRTLATELDSAVAASAPFSVDQSATSHYFQQGTSGGRLCLGQYSYIWNYGSVLQPNTSPIRNLYAAEPLLVSNSSIRFVKVYDTHAAYCSNLSQTVDPTNATELLKSGDHSLAVQDFSISTTASAADTRTAQQLYTLSFTISTNDLNALTGTGGAIKCKVPGTLGADLSYCVVQKFSIVVRAGNMVQ